MKLPKQFGGQGMAGMMQKAQEAMKRAQSLEAELAHEQVEVDKGPIKAVFSGTGDMVSIKIDPSLLNADEVDLLEDMIVSTVRDGFKKATELRESKVAEITQGLPPGLF
ncbi:MAG TPA: YbaB/EbfC family nucleoid-associated protein [Fimbriimonadaceae bacterium]|nr:YbaB/EbfC family nucleoid-associated protein [Fimbriimonadaceae bacterium]HRJ34071.1 YbaB/EbfC family nucleoid-associated protein [Fimbriimonadaceae bacterium]